MGKVKQLAIIGLLVFLVACGNDNNNSQNNNNDEPESYELTEGEKISLNLDREQYQIDDVFDLVDELEPEEVETFDGTEFEYYDPAEFVTFSIPGSGMLGVTKVNTSDEDGEEIVLVSTLYKLKNHQVNVEYFSDGRIRKSIYNQATGFIIVNDNDEEYSKFLAKNPDFDTP